MTGQRVVLRDGSAVLIRPVRADDAPLLADDPDAAEVAVTVVDDWQGRGLGTELLSQLTDRARQEGIRRFTALVAADNAAVVGLLHELGAQVRAVHAEFGAVEYDIDLPSRGIGAAMQALLSAFGRGQLIPPTPMREVMSDLVPARFPVGEASSPGPRSTAAGAVRAGSSDVAGAEAKPRPHQ